MKGRRLAPTGARAHRPRPGVRRRVRTHVAARVHAPVTRHRDHPTREFLIQIYSPRRRERFLAFPGPAHFPRQFGDEAVVKAAGIGNE
ncbi:protein of unknown function [Streptomyces sp. KY75]|nr:protein of unknown function [Streptomyces sp. KY75]